MRQIRRFYAMEEKSHACETLEQRGFWLVDNALQWKFSLLVRSSAKTATLYSSEVLQRPLLTLSGEWRPFCSMEGNRAVLPGLYLQRKQLLGQWRKLGPRADSKIRKSLILSWSHSDLINSDLIMILLWSYQGLLCIKLPYIQGCQKTLMSVGEWRCLTIGLSHP